MKNKKKNIKNSKDYSNVDFGEHVGDDIFDDIAHKESLNFTLRDGARRLTDDSLKVIEEKGIEYALEKGLVKYELTIDKKFAGIYREFFSNGDIKEEKYYFQGKEIKEEKI